MYQMEYRDCISMVELLCLCVNFNVLIIQNKNEFSSGTSEYRMEGVIT